MTRTIPFILLALVLLASAAHSAQRERDKKPEKNTVTIKDLAYDPPTIKIKKGESVTWVNKDQNDHTVDEKNGVFHSRNIKPGKSYSYTFDKAGTYDYGCTLHPRMKGRVVVAD
jgi:amicyanin